MEILIIGLIALCTFLSRYIHLLGVPFFTDEAIYIRWAQIGLHDAANRYLSLTDGKQPLLTWLMYPLLALVKDPLLAGRLVSVGASIFTVMGVYFVARELFGKKTAVCASLLYITSPFFMVYDRLALMDSLLASFAIWSLYFEIALVKKPRLDVALILGMVMGGGMLTKSSAEFFFFLQPFSLLLFKLKKGKNAKRLLKWILLSLIGLVITQVMYNSLRLSPAFYIINQKNHVFIYSFKEFFQKPFVVFLPNLNGLSQILIGYITLPIFIVVVLGALYGFIRVDKKILLLLVWFLAPFLALATFGKVIFPRFILFMTLPLYIVVADVLTRFSYFAFKKMPLFLVIVPLIFVYPAYQSLLLIKDPFHASIPISDRNQLFNDWPSGTGVKEVIVYLENEAKDHKIVVGTEGTFGLNPAVYEIYMGLNKNVEIHGYWPVSQVPNELLEKAKLYPTYLIFKERQDIPSSWPLTLIAKYKRGMGSTYLLFYKVNNE